MYGRVKYTITYFRYSFRIYFHNLFSVHIFGIFVNFSPPPLLFSFFPFVFFFFLFCFALVCGSFLASSPCGKIASVPSFYPWYHKSKGMTQRIRLETKNGKNHKMRKINTLRIQSNFMKTCCVCVNECDEHYEYSLSFSLAPNMRNRWQTPISSNQNRTNGQRQIRKMCHTTQILFTVRK